MANGCVPGDEKKNVSQESGQEKIYGEHNTSGLNSGLEAFEDDTDSDQYIPTMSDGQYLPESGREATVQMLMDLAKEDVASVKPQGEQPEELKSGEAEICNDSSPVANPPRIEVGDWDPNPGSSKVSFLHEMYRFTDGFLHPHWEPRYTIVIEWCEELEEDEEWEDIEEWGEPSEEDYLAIWEDMRREEARFRRSIS